MRLAILILLAALVACPVHAEPKKKKESGFTKVLRTMFPSAYPKVVKAKPKHKRKPTVIVKPVPPKPKYIEVDINWMAKYWEQEAAWDYYIPDDDLIRFEEGKYQVPIVVYKHYEDMAKTPHRNIIANPAPVEL